VSAIVCGSSRSPRLHIWAASRTWREMSCAVLSGVASDRHNGCKKDRPYRFRVATRPLDSCCACGTIDLGDVIITGQTSNRLPNGSGAPSGAGQAHS